MLEAKAASLRGLARQPRHTGFATHQNMVIEALTFHRDAQTSNALLFVAEVREVQIVTPVQGIGGRAAEDVVGEQAETGAVEELDQGQVVAKEVSVGAKILNAITSGP